MIVDLLILFAIVFLINLIPAFGPPTWSVLVIYGLQTDVPVIPAVLTAATAAASGRLVLAMTFRHLGTRLPARLRGNLDAAHQALDRRKTVRNWGLLFFALSPVPSAQLFEAAGLARVRLLGFTSAFFSGRIVSYAFYASTARGVRNSSLGEEFVRAISSPLGIAIQVAMIGALVWFVFQDWSRFIDKNGTIDEAQSRDDAPSTGKSQ